MRDFIRYSVPEDGNGTRSFTEAHRQSKQSKQILVAAVALLVLIETGFPSTNAVEQAFFRGIGIYIITVGGLTIGALVSGLMLTPFVLTSLAWRRFSPSTFRRWGSTVGMLLALTWALVGCSNVATAADGPDYQQMATDAVKALNGRRVWVETTDKNTLGSYDCTKRLVSLGTAGNAKWLLAHELGHYILGHCDEQLSQEIEANALAVRILQLWGMTEEASYRMTVNHLLGLQVYRRNHPRPGHNYCAEVKDLICRRKVPA